MTSTLNALLGNAYRVLRAGGVLALYTPSPSHWLKRAKAKNWLIPHDASHIGLRDLHALEETVRLAGFKTLSTDFKPSHLPMLRHVERALARAPMIGGLFRRRICIVGQKPR